LAVTGFAIDAPGTGYRVGDLVALSGRDIGLSTILFFENPVLRVISVGSLGQVLSIEMLTPGCLSSAQIPLSNFSLTSLSVVGTGFTAKRYAGPYPVVNPNTYYTFLTPQNTLVSPMQYANYSLRKLIIQSVEYTVLYLSPPEFPIVTQFFPYSNTNFSDALVVALYQFDPPVPELYALTESNYYFSLTRKNFNAINLTEDANCFNSDPNCFMDAGGLTEVFAPNSIQFRFNGISWHFHTRSPGFALPSYNYVENHAVFNLDYPLMIVLPTI
jgi:hypothetical protein